MTLKIPTTATCVECLRTFDLLDEQDAGEWYYGHDCETPERPTLSDEPVDHTDDLSPSGWCPHCGFMVILFDDDRHYCSKRDAWEYEHR